MKFEKVKVPSVLENCKPRGDRVVVRRDKSKQKTSGGVLLPDVVAQQKQQTGVVWAVGPGRYENGKRVPMDLEEGDRVVITGYAGLAISEPFSAVEDEYILLREDDILAVLPEEAEAEDDA